MRRLLIMGLVCAALAGCEVPSPFQGMVPTLPNPPGNLAADRAACAKQYPQQIGNYIAHAQCVNAAVERDAIPFARYPELVRLQEQLRLKYSTAIDAGVLSPQAGARKMAEADALVEATMRDRDRGRNTVADHRMTALQMMLE
jgi:hypothetical protein